MHCVLILHNIRSVHNVGSIFRTADAAGVEKIFLTGYTPAPVDRFGRPRADMAKVALGAEKTIPWKHRPSLAPLIRNLKKDGFLMLALEQDRRSVSLFEFRMPKRTPYVALMLGNEVRGLSPQMRAAADWILEIPMRGKKESLNVSVSTGIALFTLLVPRAKMIK